MSRSPRRPARGALGRLAICERGSELVELMLSLPILLVVVFGILELGNAFDIDQTITGLSREGANIAARGTTLDTVLAVTMTNGQGIQLSARGGLIASEVTVQANVPTVTNQVASAGYAGKSRLGSTGGAAAGLGVLGLVDGRSYYVVELFYRYQGFTPLNRFVASVIPDTLYDRSIF